MPKGTVIDVLSEVRHWTLPDFFSLKEKSIESPRFSLAGCTWFLQVFPKGNDAEGYMSLALWKDDPKLPEKKLTFALGLKKANGVVKEKYMDLNHIFKEEYFRCKRFFKLHDLQERKSELAPSGAVTFTCRALVEEVAPIPELLGLQTLSSDLKDLLSSVKNCDVTLVVQGKEFKAHRALLSTRSSVLRAMFEHDTSEANTGVVTIPDCDPESFGDFLHFLYTGKTGDLSFRTAYDLYATADKYDVQQLKDFCTSCLTHNLAVENICDAVLLADRYGNDVLMSSAQAFFNKNSYDVFLTHEWTALSKNNFDLADKLVKKMASAALKRKQESFFESDFRKRFC